MLYSDGGKRRMGESMETYRAWQTAGETYRFVFGNLGALAQIALLPFVFNVVVLLGAQALMQGGGMPGMMHFGSFLLVWLVQLAFYVTFAVAWHRHYLVGPGEAGIFVTLQWQQRHWRFAIKGILLGICILLIGFIVSAISLQIIGPMLVGPDMFGRGLYILLGVQTAMSLVFYYLLSRFLLAFPAASVDDPEIGLSASWDLTDGNSFRFFFVLILALAPLYVIEYGGSWLGASLLEPNDMPSTAVVALFAVLSEILTFIGLALSTTAASITYRKLKAIDAAARAASGTDADGPAA